jgi:hypothetical protein
VREEILEIAADVTKRQRADLSTQAGAKGRCAIVSLELEMALAAAGYPVRRIGVKGHRRVVPYPDPEGDGREEHWLVIVGDGPVIDVTRRQFDPDAELPTVYPDMQAAGRHWRSVYVDERRTQLRDLPDPGWP